MASSSFYQEGSAVPVGVTTVPGPRGDDGWAVPIQYVPSASGAVTLDYSLGKHAVITLTGNVTSVTFQGFPTAGQLARFTLELHNTSGFSWAWPTMKWATGSGAPVVTQGNGTLDWYAVTTTDGGATITGHVIGQNYI